MNNMIKKCIAYDKGSCLLSIANICPYGQKLPCEITNFTDYLLIRILSITTVKEFLKE